MDWSAVSSFVFPDNTVLCNFAAVHQLSLLRKVLSGKGRWTDAVAREAQKSSAYWPDLVSLPFDGWLGSPIEITDRQDLQGIERIRRAVFGGTSKHARQHLGEAQTCYLLKHSEEFSGSWWVSDDRDSIDYARSQKLEAYETRHLIGMAVQMDEISADRGFDLLNAMRDEGRHLRVPSSPEKLVEMAALPPM
ncbi:hypothetical protein KIH74_35405 [Kineosporia sp. J2-2]|uniref:PIN domain-containing protein n=1 Tax=Kineosporia corallincola TaxID=2835133 RepID=A0ABS5TU06_9ACTN|nr:hypothetical protein [Kineosporia corallincola]MBT0774285.1 hypothetical protein [Kineosporia corallincola]